MSPLRSVVAALPLFLLAACDDADPAGLARSDVAGTYQATELVLSMPEMGSEIDMLAEGGSLEITLNADGTTAGLLVVPDESAEGVDGIHDLEGTWVLDGTTIRLNHDEPSFLTDIDLTWMDHGIIEGESFTFPTRVVVELSRGDPALAS